MFLSPVLSLLVGMSLEAAALKSLDLGNTLTGIGQALLGIAAAIAAVASLLNGRGIKDAKTKAGVAAELATVSAENSAAAASSSAAAAATLGPVNGHTVLELLNEIHVLLARVTTFEEYQHSRNHDILNAVAALAGSVPTLLAAVEQLIDKLKESP